MNTFAKFSWIFFAVCISTISFCFSSIDEKIFEFGTSYRKDSLIWHLTNANLTESNSSGSDHIFSSKWKGVNIAQVNLEGRFITPEHVYGCIQADYGWVLQGTNEIKDYLNPPNFFNPVEMSPGQVEEELNDIFFGELQLPPLVPDILQFSKGNVYDILAGVGYEFEFFQKKLAFLPSLGYSFHYQYLPIGDYSALFSILDITSSSSGIHDHSFQKSRWYGFWIGTDFIFRINPLFHIYATYRHHWGMYRASLNDFVQSANSRADEFSLKAAYNYCSDWTFSFSLNYQNWRTRIGTIEVFVNPTVENEEISKVFHPLATVRWNTLSGVIQLGKIY